MTRSASPTGAGSSRRRPGGGRPARPVTHRRAAIAPIGRTRPEPPQAEPRGLFVPRVPRRASPRRWTCSTSSTSPPTWRLDARRADLVLLPARRRRPTTCTGSSNTPSCSGWTSRARRSATTSASPAGPERDKQTRAGADLGRPRGRARRAGHPHLRRQTSPRATPRTRPSPGPSRGSRRRCPTPPRRA